VSSASKTDPHELLKVYAALALRVNVSNDLLHLLLRRVLAHCSHKRAEVAATIQMTNAASASSQYAEQWGAVRSSQEQSGAVRSSQEQSGAVRSSQEQCGAVRSSKAPTLKCVSTTHTCTRLLERRRVRELCAHNDTARVAHLHAAVRTETQAQEYPTVMVPSPGCNMGSAKQEKSRCICCICAMLI